MPVVAADLAAVAAYRHQLAGAVAVFALSTALVLGFAHHLVLWHSFDIAGEVRAFGDRQDMQELLGNLLDNACKWAASRLRVRIDMDREDIRITMPTRVQAYPMTSSYGPWSAVGGSMNRAMGGMGWGSPSSVISLLSTMAASPWPAMRSWAGCALTSFCQ